MSFPIDMLRLRNAAASIAQVAAGAALTPTVTNAGYSAITPIIEVAVATGGTACKISAEYTVPAANGGGSALVKWQYRVKGSPTWLDFGDVATGFAASRSSGVDLETGVPYDDIQPGSIKSQQLLNAVAAGTIVELQCLATSDGTGLTFGNYGNGTARAYAITLYSAIVAPSIVGIGALATGVAGITPAYPAGVAAGDRAYMIVQTANQAVAVPAGWTALFQPLGLGTAGAAGAVRFYMFVQTAACAGTEGGTTVAVADAGDHTSARIFVVRGGYTFPGYEGVTIKNGTASTASPLIAAPRVSGMKHLVIHMLATGGPDLNNSTNFSAWAIGSGPAMTELGDSAFNSGVGGGLGIAYGVADTVTLGNATATLAAAAQYAGAVMTIPQAGW